MPNRLLYDKKSNIELDNKIQSKKHIDETVNNDKLFNDIKDIFTNPATKVKYKVFFSINSGKLNINIDNTIFAPNSIVCLSGKSFNKKYMEQLESYIFNNKDELDQDKVYFIIYIFSFINKKLTPIKITSNKYFSKISTIVSILNKFFNDNYSIIFSMYTMFNSLLDTHIENTQVKENEPVQ